MNKLKSVSKKKKILITIAAIFVFCLAGMLYLTLCNDQINVFIPNDINQAVSAAIITRNTEYMSGEVVTEGHKILRLEKSGNKVKVYAIASDGEFGFENNIFTIVSGTGAIPTVITLIKNSEGKYSTLKYEESEDGEGLSKSIKKMFPIYLHVLALNSDIYYPSLQKQEEAYAIKYLKSIGRTAKVQGRYVDFKIDNMNSDASNKLLSEYSDYPLWIGSLEKIENGKRYVYAKSYVDKGSGNGIVTYTKSLYGGSIIEKAVIEVKDGKIIYLEGKK